LEEKHLKLWHTERMVSEMVGACCTRLMQG
jgi:hypothetical protein